MKVKDLKTGKVIEVTRNVAHGLIDSGLAKLYTPVESTKPEKKYKTRAMRASKNRGYKTK